MKAVLSFGILFASAISVAGHAQQPKTRPKNSGGFYYVRTPNPQRISHYMREAGLTYLEEVRLEHEAAMHYSISLHDSDNAARESSNETLDLLEKRIKINVQAPGDKDFLSVLIYTRSIGSLSGGEVGLCSRGQKNQEECDLHTSQYIACKNWLSNDIEGGVFQDNWHTDCYGDYVEVHKRYGE